jgi:hypothetical protein
MYLEDVDENSTNGMAHTIECQRKRIAEQDKALSETAGGLELACKEIDYCYGRLHMLGMHTPEYFVKEFKDGKAKTRGEYNLEHQSRRYCGGRHHD